VEEPILSARGHSAGWPRLVSVRSRKAWIGHNSWLFWSRRARWTPEKALWNPRCLVTRSRTKSPS